MISKSDSIKSEYCCTVVKIGAVKPIEGSDFLGQTLVNGLSIVVRKDQVKEGDILIYAANETQLNEDFLSVNNLFEDSTHNADPEKRGYFNKYGRVRMIRLKGCPSMGYLFGFDELVNWCPSLTIEDLPAVGEDFDTVNGELFVKAYVPPVKNQSERVSRDRKRNKKLAKFDRLIPGQFSFHYDTDQLNRNMHQLHPEDSVTISVKLHGTSFIMGRVKIKAPKYKWGWYKKVLPYLPKFLQFTTEEYDDIYSSRTVIKNQYINSKTTSGYYGSDVWGEYFELLKGKIPAGMTIYGEIVGYVGGSNSMIQKGYDYGCKPGENQLMIYRINSITPTGEHYEWNVNDVQMWTLKLQHDYPEIAKRIHPIDIFYHGTLKDLYPKISTENHWHENVLEAMKNDKEHFGMELNEPMCRNKVPREGIVLRIDNDPLKEAFKLKCINFLFKELKNIDNNEIDIELAESDY